MEIPKIAKMKNAEKTDIFTRAISTVVFTNSAFFSFLFLKILHFLLYVAQQIGPVFYARNGFFVSFLHFFEKSSSFCREN